MTREKQIINEAIDYSFIEDNYLKYYDCGDICDDRHFIQKAYMNGVKWADETMLEKACKWLEENIDAYSKVIIAENSIPTIVLTEDFEFRFKKAMEE